MSHTITKIPKRAQRFYGQNNPYSPICELHGMETGDISPCSHFDYCERQAVIWLYDKDVAPTIYGLCQVCYDYCFPTTEYWYRVVRVSSEFNGVL